MEKDKSAGHDSGGFGGGFPPAPPSRYSAFGSASTCSCFPVKVEASSSSAATHGDKDEGRFSHDVKRMPDCPPRNTGHRRAHSEILSLPDDITFDSDLGIVGAGEGPQLSDETEEDLVSMYLDMDKVASSSVFAALGLSENESTAVVAGTEAVASSERLRVRHQHSQSFDGSTSIKPEILASGAGGISSAEDKKAISAAKLAELALVDPKRAKRIWANRQSAARSKERKMRYIAELERKILTLQTEATTLSAQLTVLQRDNTGLTAENNELKLRVQTMEQQVHLQDALNDKLREEVQRLKIATGQTVSNSVQMNYGQSSFGVNSQYYHQNHAAQSIMAHQLQQVHIHSQHQRPLQRQPSTELKTRVSASQTQENTSDNSSTKE